VRQELVRRQQKIGKEAVAEGKIVIVEGRDIGTVVFPDAAVKIYLTASEEVRAKRRLAQFQKRHDAATFEEVQKQITKRDTRDTEREASPMTNDPEKNGYFVLDNSLMNEEQTIATIITEIKRRELLHD
jgi:CMP/dCMP kinase